MNQGLFAFITELDVDPLVENEIFTGATQFKPWSYIESSIQKFYDSLNERVRSSETVDYWAEICRILSIKLKTKAMIELDSVQSHWSTAFLE